MGRRRRVNDSYGFFWIQHSSHLPKMCWTPLSNYPQSNPLSKPGIYIYTYVLGLSHVEHHFSRKLSCVSKNLQWINDCFLIRGSRYYWDIPIHVHLLNMLINTVYVPASKKKQKAAITTGNIIKPNSDILGCQQWVFRCQWSKSPGCSPSEELKGGGTFVALSARHDHPGKNPYSHI